MDDWEGVPRCPSLRGKRFEIGMMINCKVSDRRPGESHCKSGGSIDPMSTEMETDTVMMMVMRNK